MNTVLPTEPLTPLEMDICLVASIRPDQYQAAKLKVAFEQADEETRARLAAECGLSAEECRLSFALGMTPGRYAQAKRSAAARQNR